MSNFSNWLQVNNVCAEGHQWIVDDDLEMDEAWNSDNVPISWRIWLCSQDGVLSAEQKKLTVHHFAQTLSYGWSPSSNVIQYFMTGDDSLREFALSEIDDFNDSYTYSLRHAIKISDPNEVERLNRHFFSALINCIEARIGWGESKEDVEQEMTDWFITNLVLDYSIVPIS
jgi:hypothetical protein